ncbi:hypothetical protein CONPUDRAFT_143109 [Coniophora puteana RWD-64-598 SS2]|uniref:Uncharacterized protein n=1 Tax=Coniophora puteana (strain RWD-64-598) TaxID=741705 RepID=A0A5M3MVP2_CONPW|nr:uncharacterized protein CONPUDRAFT_143109 [Coniophora puteana RWD-64-598 SS2]EIW83087.1 hypothetical protein CONPUDRAFT_143109 [Coniophora puteana RWD-64-598 SS2]
MIQCLQCQNPVKQALVDLDLDLDVGRGEARQAEEAQGVGEMEGSGDGNGGGRASTAGAQETASDASTAPKPFKTPFKTVPANEPEEHEQPTYDAELVLPGLPLYPPCSSICVWAISACRRGAGAGEQCSSN